MTTHDSNAGRIARETRAAVARAERRQERRRTLATIAAPIVAAGFFWCAGIAGAEATPEPETVPAVASPTVAHVDEHLPEVWPTCAEALADPTDGACRAYGEMMAEAGLVPSAAGYVYPADLGHERSAR